MFTTQWLKRNRKTALFEAVEKLKSGILIAIDYTFEPMILRCIEFGVYIYVMFMYLQCSYFWD